MRNFRIEAFLTCLLLFFLINNAFPQDSPADSLLTFSIVGTVSDAKSKEPLPYCNVYLSRSLMGSYTQENGNYRIDNISPGTYQLVVSYIGYQTYTKTIELSGDIQNLSISLTENSQKLQDLEVTIKRDKEWENQLRKFERDLLGKIPMSRFCEITNPWVVTFTGDKNQFIATSEEPLEITNQALGFGMTMNLDKFIRNGEVFDYQGYFHFELLNPPNEKQKTKWIQNRKVAYQGSVTHFLRSLIEDNTTDAGFIVRRAGRNSQENNVYKKPEVDISELVTISRKGDLWKLEMKEPILLEYQYEYTHGETQLSLLTKSPTDEILFNSYGILRDPTKLKIGGYLAEEGVTTLLPEEYLIDGEDLIKKKTDQAIKSGIISAFNDYSNKKPLKVFLRTDKESYYSGETIWLRGYLVNAISNKPVYKKDVIHIELIDAENNVLKSHRLSSVNSGANGSVILSDSIRSGEYILRGYTNSYGHDFIRKIKILSFKDENFSIGTTEEVLMPTLDFFPESGNLIAGIKTRVAFQSNLDIFDASLFTENGKKVSSFRSSINGMGTFELKPNSKQKYYATIEGYNQKFWLPDVKSTGVSVHLNDSQQLSFDVIATDEYSNRNLYVLIHNSGRISFFETFNSTRKKEYEFPMTNFESGINHITIFDEKKRPLAERLFYNTPNPDSLISIQSNKSIYKKREKVDVKFFSNPTYDSTYSDISVAVLDLGQSSSSIDIKNYFDIFADTDIPIPTSSGLEFLNAFKASPDLFMLIYGWQRFDWNEFFYPSPAKNLADEVAISGSVKMKSGKPFAETDLVLINQADGQLYSSRTDQFGKFQFENLNITDTSTLILKVMDTRTLAPNPVFSIDTSHNEISEIPIIRKTIAISNRESDPEELQIAFERNQVKDLSDYTLLNEVVVSIQRGEKIDPRKSALGKGNYSIKTSEIAGRETFGHVYDIVKGRVPSITFVRASRGMDPNAVYVILRGYTNPTASFESQAALILVDNVPMTPDGLGAINPGDIESVEVYTGAAAAVYGARGQNGVIAYFTKRGSINNANSSDPLATSFIYKNAYYAYKPFQHPDYSKLNATDSFKDLRSTVYWNPNITLIDLPEEISFYTTDRPTQLLIDVQGVTQDGKLIHQTKIIEVEY